MYKTLISAAELAARPEDEDRVIVDCSYQLSDKAAGAAAYLDGHIPGAVYAHPYHDLSGPPLTDEGRHPLPSPERLTEVFSRLGIGPGTQVVGYDNNGITACRLWWLLKYMGHQSACVLDGGIEAWKRENGTLASGEETRPAAGFSGTPNRDMLVVRDDVLDQPLLIDSRSAGRFRGESTGTDPVAGHIPGAKNHCHALNKREDGTLREPEELRAEFERLFDGVSSEQATFYCGSGISACHNLLTLEHIGMKPGKLYVGSWSEWIRFDELPRETGAG